MDESGRQQQETEAAEVAEVGSAPGASELADSSGDSILVRIYVPELNIQKILPFRREEIVWNVKQQCLAALPKELKESFNYGLFYPPSNGRAGKFLDEERPLADYPFRSPVGYLELKYKRRVYKMLNLDEKQLRALHTRANLRRFIEHVTSAQAEKITKMCAKGLDPNFHCQDTGETPLTLAAVANQPAPLLLALVGGGAILDYRTRCGSTALHRAAERNNIEAVRTLLDLGASPNSRDAKGLTPLYNAVLVKAAPILCQALLHDYSVVGVQDTQGWHEVHQACRNGLVQHLEHLLFYGADMNSRNASGNTPLHVCAVNNQEACARLLLFRGADREALNFANQTPYQVAVIAGNLELAALIHRFKDEDIVLFKESPTYNPRRRRSVLSIRHSTSSSGFDLSSSASPISSSGISSSPSPSLSLGSAVRVLPPLPPPSPCPSERWLDLGPLCKSTASVRSDTGSSSSCTAESEDNASANGSSLTDKLSVDQCDVVSDSSGVGTSNSGSGGSYDATPTEHSLVLPGMTVVCIEAYSSKEPGHLQLAPGDIIEVTGSTDCGLLEGWIRGDSGYFPASCVQEVRLRHPSAVAAARHHQSPALVKMGCGTSKVTPVAAATPARVVGRREMSVQLLYGTAPRVKSNYGETRTVILHKGQRGFGFVLRGAKANNSAADLQPLQQRIPALQYLDSVEPDSVADRAGLRPGDFILSINGEDMSKASHEVVVDAIRRSGNLVTMTVCCAVLQKNDISVASPARQCATLPRKLTGRPPQPPKRDPRTTLSIGRARARSMATGLTEMEQSEEALKDNEAIYSSTTGRTASIRSRPGSGRVSTTDLDRLSTPTAVSAPSPPLPPPGNKTPRVYASVAEMKRMRKQRTAPELLKLHKDFHSTPDLNWEQEAASRAMTTSWTGNETPTSDKSVEDWRKSQSQDDVFVLRAVNKRHSRHSWALRNSPSSGQYHGSWQSIENVYRDIHNESEDDEDDTEEDFDEDDDEDAPTPIVDQLCLIGTGDYRAVKPCRPIYSSNTLPKPGPHNPPPNHPPPPPPPPSQVVRVELTKSSSEYAVASTLGDRPSTPVMSTFRPNDSAKLYACPEDVKSVAYMTLRAPNKASNGNAAARSLSLPLRSTKPRVTVKQNDQACVTVTVNAAPVIPEPDYDFDEDTESDKSTLRIEIKNSVPKSKSFSADLLKSSPSGMKTSQSLHNVEKESNCESKPVYITCLPVNSGEELDHQQYNKKTAGLSRHAVSLLQLPPPAECGEGEAENESSRNRQVHRELSEQDSASTVSTLSSLSTSSNSSGRDNTVLEVRPMNPRALWPKKQSSEEQTIEESLQLIRRHVDSLTDMNSYAKAAPVVPPPPEFSESSSSSSSREGTAPPEGTTQNFLPPPPPEFSDTEALACKTLPKSCSVGQLRCNSSPLSSQNEGTRLLERRLSDDTLATSTSKTPTVRVVGTVPKKVSFSPDVIDSEARNLRGFRGKPLEEWTVDDTMEWLDSLFLHEYRNAFMKKNMDGMKLSRLDNTMLLSLGVKRVGHRLNIEKSLKRFQQSRP